MFSDTLKEETKQAHQSLEKIIVQRIKAIRSPEEYKKLLQFFYSYFQPVEQLIDPFLNTDIVPDFTERRKASAILQDIRAIGGSESKQANSNYLPSIQNTADALGALYVLEGSTLGGAFIAKMLYQQAAVPDEQLHFFKGYGEKGMVMWKDFVTAINHFVEKNGKEAEVINAAKDTFKQFEHFANAVYNESNTVIAPAIR